MSDDSHTANFMQTVPASQKCINGHKAVDITSIPWHCDEPSCEYSVTAYSSPSANQPPKDTKSITPVHNCEIQGPNTEYVSTLNIKTGERGWTCIWCEMAKRFKGEL